MENMKTYEDIAFTYIASGGVKIVAAFVFWIV